VSDNVEVVRQVHEAWNRAENPLHLGLIAEDVEYVNAPEAMEPGTRHGHQGWRGAIRSMLDSYETIHIDIERIIDVGDDRVLVLGRFTGTGRVSGLDVTARQGYLWTLRDGLVIRLEWFLDQEKALAAVGLDE
jgi:ketosteroid isomerase-like protein